MAELTEEVIAVVQSTKWPEHIKQDLYVEWLENVDDMEFVNQHQMRAFVNSYLNNMYKNEKKKEGNRRRLLAENSDQIAAELFERQHSQHDSPENIVVSQDAILTKLDSLSAVLRETLVQYYVEGRAPEDIAEMNGENVEAVRKRITRARNQLKGEV